MGRHWEKGVREMEEVFWTTVGRCSPRFFFFSRLASHTFDVGGLEVGSARILLPVDAGNR